MKLNPPWKVEYKKELERAIIARLDGNEGMARVCARRAAGNVIGDYLNRRGYSKQMSSSYARLSFFTNLPDIDPKAKEIAHHFLLKVNLDHKLPLEADLISDVIWLEKTLSNEGED